MGRSPTLPPSTPVVGLWVHRLADLEGRTGVGRYAWELAGALAQRAGPSARYELRTGREPGRPAAVPVGLAVGRSRPPRRLLHVAWMAARRPRYEQVGPDADLLHVLFPSFPLATGRPLVGTIHDLFPLQHPEWYPAGERRAVARSIRRLAAEADHLVCVSRAVADQVSEQLGVEPDRLTVVHSGVSDGWRRPPWDTGRRALARGGARPYAVAVGAVGPRKNLEVAVRAMVEVPDLDLVVAGPPAAASTSLAGTVARLGLQERIRFTGRLSDEDLVDLVQGAELLVHPALDEGFGFPPLEAMAAGTPTVVSGSGALPEVVGDAAVVVDPRSPDAWAEAVGAVVRDGDRRQQLVAAGQARAAGFTWAGAAAATASVHERLLASG